jgi:GTP-binding protein HflX
MFATLDPTLRSVTLPSKRKVLLSDTVGFIRNLPHALVTSFRATLEEVQRANLVLEVSDINNPHAHEQHEQVEKVLAELEAQNKPRLQVRNKIDLLPPGARDALREDALAVNVSAAKGIGIDHLLEKIDSLIVEDSVKRLKLRVPQSEGKVLAMLEAEANILRRSYRSGFAYLVAELPESVARRVKEFVSK